MVSPIEDPQAIGNTDQITVFHDDDEGRATQPVEEGLLEHPSQPSDDDGPLPENACGSLVAFKQGLPRRIPIVLVSDTQLMSIGRNPCKTTHFPGIEHFANMPSASDDLKAVNNFTSRTHFIIKREYFSSKGHAVTMIADTSMNGTFVKVNGTPTRLPPCGVNDDGSRDYKWQLLETGTVIFIGYPTSMITAGNGTMHGTMVFMYTENTKRIGPLELNERFTVLDKVLGQGAFGKVYMGVCRTTQSKVAVKVVQTVGEGTDNRASLRTEIDVLKKARHPACIEYNWSYFEMDKAYIVMECCVGGEFFDFVTHKEWNGKGLGEALGVFYARQLFTAIAYLHKQNIAHRDLKPENVLIKALNPDKRNLIKITDFGMARVIHNQTQMKSVVGTPQYIAPEIVLNRRGVKEEYTFKVDVFSAGAIIFIAISGIPPFSDQWRENLNAEQQILASDATILRRIYGGDLTRTKPGRNFAAISNQGLKFVRECMATSADNRLSAAHALEHKWFKIRTPSKFQLAPNAVESKLAMDMMKDEAENMDIAFEPYISSNMLKRPANVSGRGPLLSSHVSSQFNGLELKSGANDDGDEEPIKRAKI